jgi:hypothetical protein
MSGGNTGSTIFAHEPGSAVPLIWPIATITWSKVSVRPARPLGFWAEPKALN